MNNKRIQRLHKFMHDFKKFLRDNKYDIEEKDIQWYLRGLVHFNVNELKERIMGKKDFIEIPFGAKDSELCGREYTIPQGYTASIENGKIIVKKNDGMMIKHIIDIIKCAGYRAAKNECFYANEIAWLEKQGEQSQFLTNCIDD